MIMLCAKDSKNFKQLIDNLWKNKIFSKCNASRSKKYSRAK